MDISFRSDNGFKGIALNRTGYFFVKSQLKLRL